MNPAAKSIFTWGILMLAFGISYFLTPNLLLPFFGLPQTTDVWIRVSGLLIAILGGYYLYSARKNDIIFFRITIPGRILFASGLAVLVVLGFSKAPLLILSAVDTFGALWTWYSFRSLDANQC
jgi:hypothetical protein